LHDSIRDGKGLPAWLGERDAGADGSGRANERTHVEPVIHRWMWRSARAIITAAIPTCRATQEALSDRAGQPACQAGEAGGW